MFKMYRIHHGHAMWHNPNYLLFPNRKLKQSEAEKDLDEDGR